jgi:hypothetical protein
MLDEKGAKTIANWHTSLSAETAKNKELIDSLEKMPSDEKTERIFGAAAKEFDKKLLPGGFVYLSLSEISEDFSLAEISEEEFKNQESKHSYGQYIGFQTIGCIQQGKAKSTKRKKKK